MISRRNTIRLVLAAPLLAREAAAQEGGDQVKPLFAAAFDYLNEPVRVNENYRRLFYYVDLIGRAPPKGSDAGPDVVKDAMRTYGQVGELIAKSEAKFDRDAASKVMVDLIENFAQRQKQLQSYCEQVGLRAGSEAERLIEESIASMMLFYSAAVKALKFKDTDFCIYPFCARRPR